MIQCSIRSGLDGVVFTDHGRLPPKGKLEKWNDKYHPFRVFTGIEISILMDSARPYGVQDFIVVGLDNHILESGWSYDRLLRWVRDNGGWISLAHPYRYDDDLPRAIIDNPPDAVELYSNHIRPELAPRINLLAQDLGCRVVGVSDAHEAEDVGYSAVNLVKPVFSDTELVMELKKGAFDVVRPKAADAPLTKTLNPWLEAIFSKKPRTTK